MLAVDIGNTETVVGYFCGGELRCSWRLQTQPKMTSDELCARLVAFAHIDQVELASVNLLVLSSVVPSLNRVWSALCKRFDIQLLNLSSKTAVSMRFDYPAPHEVGADRIANALAAVHYYGAPSIVVDFGTATNFDVISAQGAYVGGIILPGIGISSDALFARAAKLATIDLSLPQRVVGRSTTQAVQSGLLWGAGLQASALIERIKIEESMPTHAPVIATGGLASLVAQACPAFTVLDPDLTLKGLHLAGAAALEHHETGCVA